MSWGHPPPNNPSCALGPRLLLNHLLHCSQLSSCRPVIFDIWCIFFHPLCSALENQGFEIIERGEIEVKGKGKMTTYFLIRNLNASEDEIMGRPQSLLDRKEANAQGSQDSRTVAIMRYEHSEPLSPRSDKADASEESTPEGGSVAGQDSVEAADRQWSSDWTGTPHFPNDALPSAFCALL
uniref:guanylate cyclase soluble subunit beta-2-like n=1 Tax=Halichoerus grypus TaxID=9711 RepID=UPI0016593E04|nr:guanylate cyclase soluble subunit beta-2-like [Halichoerus grypus]